MKLMRHAEDLMVQYAAYHRDRRNIATHLVGIPLIVTAIGVLLAQPLAGPLTLAWALWAVSSLWYLTRGAPLLGVATVVVNGACMVLAQGLASWASTMGWAPWSWGLVLFGVGWAFQFVGHAFEGRKPAFVDDIVGLLVGPMFVVGEVLMARGLLAPLRARIEAEAGPLR